MNQQERQVISDIFDRLKQAANQPRDPEAERFIADKLREQPYAPYAMAQSIFVQEQALANLNAQMQQLQAEVEELRQQPQASGGFLSSIFGGGAREPERAPRPGSLPGQSGPWGGRQAQDGNGAGQGGPWGGQAGMQAGGQPGMMGGQPGMMQRGGSGFLGTALTTAAGVAGGMMLGNVLTNAFKGPEAGAGAAGAAGATGGADQASFLSGGGEGAAGAGSAPQAGITDGMYQDAGYDQGGGFNEDFGSDAGGDFGGGDDYA